MNESTETDLVGRTIGGKFLVESPIGVGAMGAVYRARQIALGKAVAVKVMHPDRAGDPMYASLFQREATAASRLDHPNSVRVIDFGQEQDGLLYIAMEYFAGSDLLQVLSEDWPLSSARIVDILSQALAAIAVAHDLGIVHRDLKPENILVQRGTDDEGAWHDVVKVCDFGIAKFTDPTDAPGTGGKKLTEGVVIGTPHYMSPEQGQGEALDARTDVYSMGVILYQMLTSRVPFDGKTLVEVVIKHVRDEPVPPAQDLPSVDRRLEAICLKAMKKSRADRYQSARDMRAELRAVLVDASSAAPAREPVSRTASTLPPPGERTSASSTSLHAHPPQRGPRTRARAALLAAVVAVCGAAAVLLMRTLHACGPATSLASSAIAASAALSVRSPSAPPRDAVETLPRAKAPVQVSAREDFPAEGPSRAKARRATRPREPPPAVESADLTQAELPEPAPTIARLTTTPPSAPADPPPPTNPKAPAPKAPPSQANSQANPWDPSRSRVDWSVSTTGGGATATEVRRALARASSTWTQCYQNALRTARQRVEGPGVLHLTTDDEGNVVQARVTGFTLSNVGPCISGSVNVRILGVDTGAAWAEVKLVFRAEPSE